MQRKDSVVIHLSAPHNIDLAGEQWLDQHELSRANAFKFAQDRALYVAAHSFLRQSLSHYAPLTPDAWRFVHNAYGKPAIANQGYQALQFNLSHTQGLIACAISHTHTVGVDVEQRKTLADLAALCRYAFTPQETAHVLAQHSVTTQEKHFFTYWTLKEAYIKAKGMGLSIPLQDFYFSHNQQQQWQIHTTKELEAQNQHWQFNTFATQQHHLAIAIAPKPMSSHKSNPTSTPIKLIVQDQSFHPTHDILTMLTTPSNKENAENEE